MGDIDWKRGTLSVRRTLVENGKLEVGEPKTRKGRRLITLPRLAQAALQEQLQSATDRKVKSPWVFFDTNGGPLRPSNLVRRSFRPLLKRAELPRIRFHDLRHTAATLLLRAGVHPKVVQERLGHAQIAMTLDTYSHVLPSIQREAAGKLDELLGHSIPDQARTQRLPA
jgi:integrase